MSPKSLNELIGIAAKYIISKMTISADEVSSVYMYIYMYKYVYVYILLHTIHTYIKQNKESCNRIKNLFN